MFGEEGEHYVKSFTTNSRSLATFVNEHRRHAVRCCGEVCISSCQNSCSFLAFNCAFRINMVSLEIENKATTTTKNYHTTEWLTTRQNCGVCETDNHDLGVLVAVSITITDTSSMSLSFRSSRTRTQNVIHAFNSNSRRS